MLSCGVRNGHCAAASSPSVALPAPQEWYIGRWPSGPVVASIEIIRKQPGQVLGHINSLAICKCRWLPELIKATVPLACSEAEAIRRVTLVQQEHKLALSEMREACRALKAAAGSDSGIPAGKLCRPQSTVSVCLWQQSGRGWCGRGWLCGRGVVAVCGNHVTYIVC